MSWTAGIVVSTEELTQFQQSLQSPSKYRNFRIICQDVTFFVNVTWLAENSKFFETAVYGNFAEARNKEITLSTHDVVDVQEYLFVMYGRRGIDYNNCAKMMELSDIWDTPVLAAKCKYFMEKCRTSSDLEEPVRILEVAFRHGFQDHTANLVFLISAYTTEQLDALNFLNRIKDPKTISEVYRRIGYKEGQADKMTPARGSSSQKSFSARGRGAPLYRGPAAKRNPPPPTGSGQNE